MPIFTAKVDAGATLYIRAFNTQNAQQLLNTLVGTTIDASDKSWFSDATFETAPRVSFRPFMWSEGSLSLKVQPALLNVETYAPERFTAGAKAAIFEGLLEGKQLGDEAKNLQMFAFPVLLRLNAFIKADDEKDAEEDVDYWGFRSLRIGEEYDFRFTTRAFRGNNPMMFGNDITVVKKLRMDDETWLSRQTDFLYENSKMSSPMLNAENRRRIARHKLAKEPMTSEAAAKH